MSWRRAAAAALLSLAAARVEAQQRSDSTARDSSHALPEIVVTATRQPRPIKSLTGSAAVVTDQDFAVQATPTVDAALHSYAGVNAVGDARFGEEVRLNLRGFNSGFSTQRALILLDGRPLTSEYLGETNLVLYPLASMARVEMVRGVAGAAYGSNALGGVVNLIPRRGGPTPSGIVNLEGGSFGTAGVGASYGGMIGTVDVEASGGARTTNGYRRNELDQPVDWDGQYGFLNVGREASNLSLRAMTSFYNGGGTDNQYDRDLTLFAQDIGAQWRSKSRSANVTTLRAYYQHFDQNLRWFEAPTVAYQQWSAGAVLTQTIRAGSRNLLMAGLEGRTQSADVTEFAGPIDVQEGTLAAFVQDEISAGHNVSLVLGLRFDQAAESKSALSYRAGANWLATQTTILRASIGSAFRAPTISDRYLPPTPFFGLIFVGNPDLEPETAVSLELGIQQEITRGIVATLTGYATQANNFWDFIPDTGVVYQVQNIARVSGYGIEAEVTAQFGAHFNASATYTWTDQRYREFQGNPEYDGNYVDDNVPSAGSFGLTYLHPAGHTAFFGVQFVGKRYTDPANSPEGILPGYTLARLAGAIQVARPLVLRLTIENLLNVSYQVRPEFFQAWAGYIRRGYGQLLVRCDPVSHDSRSLTRILGGST